MLTTVAIYVFLYNTSCEISQSKNIVTSLHVPITFHITIGISINNCKLCSIIMNLVNNGHGVFPDIITIAIPNPEYIIRSSIYDLLISTLDFNPFEGVKI